MDFLGNLLKTFLGGAAIKALSKKTGISGRTLKKFLPLAVPFLLKILTKNASSEEGASSLLAALAQHTDDKPVDKQIADADIVDGAKIIGHILGSSQAEDVKNLSKQSKLSETAVSGILSSIAPALLTSLSKAVFGSKTKSSSKKSGLAGLVGGLFGSKSAPKKKSGVAGLLSGLLGSKSSAEKKTGLAGLVGGLLGGKSSSSRKSKKSSDGFDGAALLSALLSQK